MPKGPHHHHRRHHRPHDDRLTETIRELVDIGHINDLDELARVAEEHEPGGEAAAYLTRECQNLPLDLAIDQLAGYRRVLAYRRQQELVTAAREMVVLLVPPLPPHICDLFAHLPKAVVLTLGGHDLPPHMRGRRGLTVYGPHEGRRLIKTADLVVFDAYPNGTIHARRELADLLDGQILKPSALLRAHMRPHLAPEDVEVDDDIRARIVAI